MTFEKQQESRSEEKEASSRKASILRLDSSPKAGDVVVDEVPMLMVEGPPNDHDLVGEPRLLIPHARSSPILIGDLRLGSVQDVDLLIGEAKDLDHAQELEAPLYLLDSPVGSAAVELAAWLIILAVLVVGLEGAVELDDVDCPLIE